MDCLELLRELSKAAGVRLVERPNMHITIIGQQKVDYWPTSAKHTVYIAQSGARVYGVTPNMAVALACSDTEKKYKRPASPQTKAKHRLHALDPHCKYCGKELTLEEATVDHIIPLSKGGTNRWHNKVLACSPCNAKKGDKIL
jgi:5-methylcytosine-specific restriction endonuclease McrA